MNFDLTEDEEMLKALAERFVADRYDAERRREYLSHEAGFSSENWALLGELGLIAALFDAEDGGLGISATGLVTAFEALGRGLVVEPLIENVALAARLFARVAPPRIKEEWLSGLIGGERRLALAHREHAARKNESWVEVQASTDGRDSFLSGEKFIVPGGAGVDAYVVSARTGGEPAAPDGAAFFLLDASAPGLSTRSWRLVDGSVAVTLTLDGAKAVRLGGTLADLAREQFRATLLRSAEALGVMDRLLADTLEYLRTRKQFGVSLGSFQALQHRMVAQYAATEQARALLQLASMASPEDEPRWTEAIEGCRAFIAEASVTFGHEMIQMHGGMGVTDELIIGHGHKRLLMLSRWPDGAEEALDRYAGIKRVSDEPGDGAGASAAVVDSGGWPRIAAV
jgi:alkylation response protein AidB-like acyl-CoA dehydrogenase